MTAGISIIVLMAATKHSPPKETTRKADFARDILQSVAFQRREWIVQRIGWALIVLVLLAGLLGLFGRGPLAERTLANAVLQFEYEWLTHRDAQTIWKLTPLAAPVDGRYRVALDANWAQHFRIHVMQPEPASARLADGRWVYEFEARDVRDLPIVFHVEARTVGSLEGSIALNDSAPLQISQFVYP